MTFREDFGYSYTYPLSFTEDDVSCHNIFVSHLKMIQTKFENFATPMICHHYETKRLPSQTQNSLAYCI